ncbi:hypothetical protein ISX50_02165 [Vibrio cyclitrophicus]|nr:hypothetical protein [Vibrio cyclitrophicus]UPR34883.1 hypothetical protein ISX50_02165 [Vibrio cyclitrophicus]
MTQQQCQICRNYQAVQFTMHNFCSECLCLMSDILSETKIKVFNRADFSALVFLTTIECELERTRTNLGYLCNLDDSQIQNMLKMGLVDINKHQATLPKFPPKISQAIDDALSRFKKLLDLYIV